MSSQRPHVNYVSEIDMYGMARLEWPASQRDAISKPSCRGKLVNVSFFAARHTLAQASFTAVGEGGGREVNSMRGRTYPGPHPSRRGGSPQLRVGASYRDVSQAISLGIILVCILRGPLLFSFVVAVYPCEEGEKPNVWGENLTAWACLVGETLATYFCSPGTPPKKEVVRIKVRDWFVGLVWFGLVN